MKSEVEQEFFEFLSGLGFPSSSIVYEPAFKRIDRGRKYSPDFAVLDPGTNEPLAIIEIKARDDPETLSRAIQQVQQYVFSLRDRAVRGFVATPAPSAEGFSFYTGDEEGRPKQVPSPQFLRLESLSAARIAEKKAKLSEEKEETTDRFFIVCTAAALFAVIMVFADFVCSILGVTLLTTARVGLLGAALALVIIPYAQKFRGLGIEFERMKDQAAD